MLYILHHSEAAWKISQRTDGTVNCAGKDAGGAGRKGADSCRIGDYGLRNGSVWTEIAASSVGSAV